MKAKERYRKGQAAAREGRYEEALAEYEWFHEHALDDQPALYGVRLSFALSDWVDLGKVYPPAIVSLQSVRDSKAARLRSGDGDRELFHDVEAINETLGDFQATYDLLVHLVQHQPNLAQECASLAMRSIVQARDFALARTFINDPERSVQRWVNVFNEDVTELALEPPSNVPKLDAYVYIYAQRVAILLSVLRGVGEQSLADAIHQQALSSIESASAREAVSDAIIRGPEAA